MPSANPRPATSRFGKFFELLYGFLAIASVLRALMTTVFLWRFHYYNEAVYTKMFIIFLACSTLIALGLSMWWHGQEKDESFNPAEKHAWLQGVLHYYLAFEISIYGFAKLLKTQFAVSYARADAQVGNLSGFELTWNYFGYSHTFAVIIGLIQIGGATLLLFKRTRLLAVFMLLPVMVNVVLINIFYSIAIGAFINSLIITFGLLYLLLLRWTDIMALFFPAQEKPAIAKVNYLKPVLKLLVIALAFVNIYCYVVSFPSSAFTGKWTVQQVKINGKIVADTLWQNHPNLWRNIYMEQWGYMEISSNPYVFDGKKSKVGSYSYDEGRHRLKIIFSQYPAAVDSAIVWVSHCDGDHMQWYTVLHNDTLQYNLLKANAARP